MPLCAMFLLLLDLLPHSATFCNAFGQIISELPSGSNWNFDVHWYPKIPGIISASSFDGKIGIYNVEVFLLLCANNADSMLSRLTEDFTMNIIDYNFHHIFALF